MPPKELVFIHHSQRGGRLPQSGAAKVWRHVSQRSWQKKSGQVTFKSWKPPEERLGRDEAYSQSDLEAIAIPHLDLQQAYMSKVCLQHLRQPEDLAMLQTTLYMVREHKARWIIRGVMGTQSEELQREIFKTESHINDLATSLRSGADDLQAHNFAQAFTSFEFASRLVKQCMGDCSHSFFTYVTSALAYTECRNGHEVVRQFLKHVANVATVSLGPRHAISTWARTLLMTDVTLAVAEKVFLADLEAGSVSQPDTQNYRDLLTFEWTVENLGVNYNLSTAEHDYKVLMDRGPISMEFCGIQTGTRYTKQYLTLHMGLLYLVHHRFIEAASVLSDAPADLKEWVSNGWMPSFTVKAPPISMTMIVHRLFMLGQALAGQGIHGSASRAFKLAISAGVEYFTPDFPACIRAQQVYSEYLSSQKLKEEVDEIDRLTDFGMEMYKLRPSNNEEDGQPWQIWPA